MSTRIVFFDGTCNFCNAAVDFLIRRDPRGRLRYSSLQSPFAARFFARHNLDLDLDRPDRIVYFSNGELHTRSGAALRIPRALSGAWPLLSCLLVFPPRLRDRLYDLVARHRYRILGRSATCRIPGESERHLFLEE